MNQLTKISGHLPLSLLTLLLCLFNFCLIYAQSPRLDVAGVVKDKTGEPLIGVTVNEVGTHNTTITNVDGQFKLMQVSRAGHLRFSYVGMQDLVVPVKDGNMSVEMEADAKVIDQVVVIGYGSVNL